MGVGGTRRGGELRMERLATASRDRCRERRTPSGDGLDRLESIGNVWSLTSNSVHYKRLTSSARPQTFFPPLPLTVTVTLDIT